MQHSVFVSNLDRRITDQHLKEQFKVCGRITGTRLVKDGKGRSKGFGYIYFHDSKGQANAVGRNGMKMGKNKILVAKISMKKPTPKAIMQKSLTGKKVEERKEVKEHRRKNIHHNRNTRTKQHRIVNMGFLTREQKIQMFENQSRAFGAMHHFTGRKLSKGLGDEIKEWTESTKLYVQALRKFDEYNNSFGDYLASVKKTQDATFDMCLALQEQKQIDIRLKVLQENNKDLIKLDEFGKIIIPSERESMCKTEEAKRIKLVRKGLKKLKNNGINQKSLPKIITKLRSKTKIKGLSAKLKTR